MNTDQKLDRILDLVQTPAPIQLAELRVEMDDLEKRVDDLERAAFTAGEWKRGPMLLAAVALLGSAANVAILLLEHH